LAAEDDRRGDQQRLETGSASAYARPLALVPGRREERRHRRPRSTTRRSSTSGGETLCRFAASWDQPDGVFRRVMGPPLLQAEGTTRGGRDEEFFAASWDQPICRGKGPGVPAFVAGHESSDREVSKGLFRRRRGSPSGGAHALPGADHDRHQGSAAPLVGATESSPNCA